MKKTKHELAKKLIANEINVLSGKVFARYLISKDEESNSSVESMEFLEQLITGSIEVDKREFLLPYLEPLWEVIKSYNLLEEDEKSS
jgi:hypothetical protein